MISLEDFSRFSAYVDTKALAAATAATITVPTGYSTCIMVADADCYYRRGGTAVAGVTSVVDGTASNYMPAKTRRLLDFKADKADNTPLATFSIISTAGGQLTLEWFK